MEDKLFYQGVEITPGFHPIDENVAQNLQKRMLEIIEMTKSDPPPNQIFLPYPYYRKICILTKKYGGKWAFEHARKCRLRKRLR